MWDDEYSQVDQNAEYRRDNIDLESGLWAEWVMIVCRRQNIDCPTQSEWSILKNNFYSGKMPIISVEELVTLRRISR